MKVAVIGAAGWVGRAVLANFAGRHEVRAFDFSPQAWDVYRQYDGDWDGEKVYGDVSNFADVHAALDGMDGAISSLIVGCDNQPDLDLASALWDAWWDAGGNGFDTAHIYGQGLH